MLRYKQFITEGGNVKIGDIKTDPISTANRSKAQADIKSTLAGIHHNVPIFGPKFEDHLSGSTAHLFNKSIPDSELHHYKPSLGDVDVMVNHSTLPKLQAHLSPGTRVGHYTVVGHHKHGNELSTLMKHDSGHVHQFDFEGVGTDRSGSPSIEDKFAHSSNWNDTKLGIKGVHHKRLLNSAGGEKYKFSITHGLKERSRTDKDVGQRNPYDISKGLFGIENPKHKDIDSFTGVTHLIKKHIPAEHHQAIYDHFKIPGKEENDSNALSYLRKHLNINKE